MSLKSSLLYLPPNLRDADRTPLYPHVAGVYDKALELAFLNEINKLNNLYNPSSEYYDTDYILTMLGENTLQNLLSDITDKVSLTMIVSDIQNIKGTKKAFDTILKLIKINYKQIIYTTLPNGCTEVTLILDSSTRVDITTIADLIRFSQEVFPLCLSLSSVTNCLTYDSSMSYSGYNELDFGQHTLDRTFVLDMSKLDTTYGKTITTSAGSLNVLLCNPTYSDCDLSSGSSAESVRTSNINSSFIYSLYPFPRLDRDLLLDKSTQTQYYGSSTFIANVVNFDMKYSSYVANLDATRTNVSQFRLDRDPLDRFFYRRLDGVLAYTPKTGLDFGLKLDTLNLDLNSIGQTKHFTSLSMRTISSDSAFPNLNHTVIYTTDLRLDSSNQVTTASDTLVARDHFINPYVSALSVLSRSYINKITFCQSSINSASKVAGRLGVGLKLDYSQSTDSQYLPALTI